MTTPFVKGQTSPPLRLGLAGYGKMGRAMVSSLQRSGLIASIDIYDPFSPDKDPLKDEDEFIAKSHTWDMLVLAIKPQTLDGFLQGKEKSLPPALPVLSILAGKTQADLLHKFSAGNPVIRSMPNTPAAIGKGMSVAMANTSLSRAQKDMVESILLSMGTFLWIEKEEDMDVITALSGSGPAYVFYMMEAMAKAGQCAGLDKATSLLLARQTVVGAAALADFEKTTAVDILRQNVTSPNGTTAAGLSVLMDGRLQDILNETIKRATARSQELSST